jgi:hypothetical protein
MLGSARLAPKVRCGTSARIMMRGFGWTARSAAGAAESSEIRRRSHEHRPDRRRAAGAPDFRPPGRRGAPERPSEPDFSRRPPGRPEFEEPVEPEVLPRAPSLEELLEDITVERAGARGRYEAEEVPWAEPRAPRPGFPLAGCVVRIVGLVFLLIAAAIVFLFLLFGGFVID